MSKKGRRRPALTERHWHTLNYIQLQSRLFTQKKGVKLGFSAVRWFDLWPTVQIARGLLYRIEQGLPAVRLELPFTRAGLRYSFSKPLNFLVDIGLVAIATRCGAELSIDNQSLAVECDQAHPSGLSESSLEALCQFGYQIKEYSDRIMLPISVIESEESVEVIREKLWGYTQSSLKYLEDSLADGSLIDTFFREIVENAIEHSGKSKAVVAARLLRSIWDIPSSKLESTVEARLTSHIEAIRPFLEVHRDKGYVELVVIDSGAGIRGTLPGASDLPAIETIYRALSPTNSRFSVDDRLSRGRSPLTGLGACAYCLERLPTAIIFREPSLSVLVSRESSISPEGTEAKRGNLHYHQLPVPAESKTIGLNVQLFFMVAPHAHHGKQIRPDSLARGLDHYQRIRVSGRQMRDVRTLMVEPVPPGARATILDVTDSSNTKNPAWRILEEARRIQKRTSLPVVLVGVGPSLLARLSENLQPLDEVDLKKLDFPRMESPGFFCIGLDLRLHYISNRADDAQHIVEAFVNEAQPPSRFYRQLLAKLEVLDPATSQYRFTPSEVVATWKRGQGAWLLSEIESAKYGSYIRDIPVQLPNGLVVRPYFDLFGAMRQPRLKQSMLEGLGLYLASTGAEAVITFSAGGRALTSELLRKRFKGIHQVDFPDPYTPADRVPGLRGVTGRKTVIIADAVHTQGHVSRIVESCLTQGVEVGTIIAFLNSDPKRKPVQPIEVQAMLAKELAVVDEVAKYQVDPFSLSLQPLIDRGSVPCLTKSERSLEVGSAFYNTMGNQKAFMMGHMAHRSGRHFSLAVDFHQLIQPNYLNRLLSFFEREGANCKALVYPEESIVSEIGEGLSESLDIPSPACIPAIAVASPSRRYIFSSAGIERLRLLGKEKVLFIDDAISSGRAFFSAIRALAHYGIETVKVCVILNNTALDYVIPSQVNAKGTEVKIDFTWLHRSFFPVYASSDICPYCRILKFLARSSRACPNSVVSLYLRARHRELEAIDVRSAVRSPKRCARSTAIEIPQLDHLGLPRKVQSRESFEVALGELSCDDEGIQHIYELLQRFSERNNSQFYLKSIFRILGQLVPSLERLGCSDGLLEVLVEVLESSSGEQSAALLETALLWPVEFLSFHISSLFAVKSQKFWASDSSLAVFYSLLHRIISESNEHAASRVYKLIESFSANEPEDSVRIGIVRSLAGMFAARRGPLEQVAWAWHLLASRLLVHRKAHHRILERLTSLRDISGDSSKAITGISTAGSANMYLALFLCLADIRKALQILTAHGALPRNDGLNELMNTIGALLKERGRLRSLVMGESAFDDAERDKIIDRIKELSFVVSSYTSPSEGSERAMLFTALHEKIDTVYRSLVGPITKLLESTGFTVDLENSSETGSLLKAEILKDPILIQRLVDSVSHNIKTYSPLEIFRKVSISVRRCGVDKIETIFSNRCDDPSSERRFFSGNDYHGLASEVRRLGGDYSACYKDGRLLTMIQFRQP